MKYLLIAIVLVSLIGTIDLPAQEPLDNPLPSGNAVIRGSYAGSEIVITTTERLAGAIHSLKWNGQEFIDSVDHGRQLQSASNFDASSPFTAETFNPTEAGSRFDGAGEKSSSRLLHFIATENQLQSTSQMAFWLRPGEKSVGNAAKNTTVLSNHLLTKRVTIGYQQFPNVIQYDVSFGVPIGEKHRYAQFEALTGYMPIEFQRFLTLDTVDGKLVEISDGPGEQHLPLVFSTVTGSHAMGIFSPDQPSTNYEQAGYGRFRFTRQNVVKWNCVFRERVREPVSSSIEARDYAYRMFVIVGSLENVRATMQELHAMDFTGD